MDVRGHPQEEEARASPPTLGDVLYADKSRRVAPEQDWVRLVESMAAGDQLALHALYERAHRPAFTLAVRILGNRETAEEVTLDVFHDVWRRAARYDPRNGTVLGWIMNQARSRAIDRLRFDGRKKRVDSLPDEPAREAIESADFLELKQQSEALRGALTVLTPDERKAIEAAFYSDLTYAEVAMRLSQPLGTVKTRIRSALQKLRSALTDQARQS